MVSEEQELKQKLSKAVDELLSKLTAMSSFEKQKELVDLVLDIKINLRASEVAQDQVDNIQSSRAKITLICLHMLQEIKDLYFRKGLITTDKYIEGLDTHYKFAEIKLFHLSDDVTDFLNCAKERLAKQTGLVKS